MAELHRMDNGQEWRVVPESQVAAFTAKGYADNGPGNLVRGATSGFDNRPWAGISITDPGDIEASTRPPEVDNFVLIYAWNEWHEGGHIEPNVRDGCAYLDTIRDRLKLPTGSGRTPNPAVN